MAWEWSHTQEGLDNARANLYDKPREWLEVCWAEWQAQVKYRTDPSWREPNFSARKYTRAMATAKQLPTDVLVEAIWGYAEQLQTCDNGGFNCYVCPWGCHTVPFDREEVEGEEL